ncbi:nuclear GTPase SLIP-GC [Tachyglossus aculeatus]|uniref:nuclear GTPase SLIP-GC n=1 Tax=Tachyglossus aculeatus TaxID=9261 RepID=UPI0018F51264|nr:nuclear GTPase SLIP-GC [Tachyglossus aculeatus]
MEYPMADAEVFVDQVSPSAKEEPGKKRRRSGSHLKFRAFPSAEQSALKEYEKLESRTRRVLSTTYQKIIQSVFFEDGIPSGVKYLINRLLALIEKPSLEPVYIGLFGSTGAGKSSLLNAIINEKMFLPVSGESTCTSCLVQVSSGVSDKYEAKIHLLSDQEWKEELRNLTELLDKREEGQESEENDWGDDSDIAEEAVQKLQMLYGRGAENKSYEELLRTKLREKIPTSKIITLKGEEASELSAQLDSYIRIQTGDADGQLSKPQIQPLIKYVEVTLPYSEVIPEGVVLVDIPGTGDFNSERDDIWKKTINKCSVIWVISDIERVSGGKAHEVLLRESLKACQRGVCTDISLVVTKADKLYLPEYLRERKNGKQAIGTQREAILERNGAVKLQRSRILKEKLKRKLPSSSMILDAPELVYTVSAQEYWQQELLSEEETEIPKLREYIRKRFLREKRKTVTEYVAEAFGILLLMDNFNSKENFMEDYFHPSGLKRFVEERVTVLEEDVDQCFAQMEQPLQEGVTSAKSSYRKILSGRLTRSKGNQGFHQTLKAVCLKNGIFASRTLARIDLNEDITQPIYDKIDPIFGSIFRTGKDNHAGLLPHLDAFKLSLHERIRNAGLRSDWKSDSYKQRLLSQEVNVMLGALEGHVLRKKRCIYESVYISVQNELKYCYEEAAQVTGKKACERMKDIIKRGVERQVAEGMFERAQSRMQEQFQELKSGIMEKMKMRVSTMLALASSKTEGLYIELPDVKTEYKEMEKLYKSLREIAENAVLRKGLQDFLIRMSPSKVGPAKS